MSYKNFALYGLAAPLLCLTFLINLLYIYDPLQVFHTPYFRKVTFSTDMRVQNRGIIKFYDFNSVILGTSMLENTLPKDANEIAQDREMQAKWVNLSMSGSTHNERAVALKYMLRLKDIKNVIYSLDAYVFGSNADTSKFDFLYDNNPYNDMKIYINDKFIKCAITWNLKQECVGKEFDIFKGSLAYWANHEPTKSYFGGLKNYLKNPKNVEEIQRYLESKNFTESNLQEYTQITQEIINKNIIEIARDNPKTTFHLVIPTYSRAYYIFNDIFDKYKISLLYLTKASKDLANIRIYGFDDLEYADNIANYKDAPHYNTDMNVLQLYAIKNHTNIIDSKNIESYLQIMQDKIAHFDITPFINALKEMESKDTKKVANINFNKKFLKFKSIITKPLSL